MADDEMIEVVAPPPLGAGDSPAGVIPQPMPPVRPPLGAGDAIGSAPMVQVSAPPPLGAGETPPGIVPQIMAPAPSPLGAGETPPGVLIAEMPPVRSAPGAGDLVGPETLFDVRALAPPGPGELAVPRPAIRIARHP